MLKLSYSFTIILYLLLSHASLSDISMHQGFSATFKNCFCITEKQDRAKVQK